MSEKIVFSGVQPSGALTLGNYLGAIRNFVTLQYEARCYFCVVDLHALTVPQEPERLRAQTLEVARLFIACGLDPAVSTIFVQSHVAAHTQLSWLLECITYVGELRRMTQFKEKARKQEVVSTGLMTYPDLMAADILLYDTTHVPVGEDQKQHLELTRNLAERFNNRFGPIFVVPEPYIAPRQSGSRIMSLTDPTKKMSKSDENPNSYILLTDPPDVIRKKFARAVTDNGREVRYDEKNKPGVSNLMVILSLCSGRSLEEIARTYNSSGYAQFKKDTAEAVIATLEPIQRRYQELVESGAIDQVLCVGAARARQVASAKLAVVQDRMGLVRAQCNEG
ncbi:MAG TPA: tryptophan--tRNA ligase [Chloroflexota bacterium]|jgi:tryptophanyl-tRNA synthetase|nr:tryptophan--tRNA ligase [Chloroflexota bacterium]